MDDEAPPPPTSALSRRSVLRALGASVAFLPVAACGSRMALEDAGAGGGDAGPVPDAGVSGWASGGTAAMTDAATYPDPFEAGGAACPLFVASTLGPCLYTSPERRDLSEGTPGLPVRLALRVVDEACAPLAGARVDVWHTGWSGLYSGGPIDFCTSGDPDAIAHLYGRGAQVTDAEGKVGFDTCFPGWYGGRAIHIHFQVVLAGGASATLVSQLFFEPALIEEIFASHPDYAAFGQPDTPNASDGIYRGVGVSGIVERARMSDGAMLAWKEIVVRSA